MVPRVVAVALVATVTFLAVAEPAQANWFDAQLRSWDWQGPIKDSHALKLAPDEEYDRYFFSLEGSGSAAVAYITVNHEGTNDSLCTGEVVAVSGETVSYFGCHDLRVGHLYRVEIHQVGGGTVTLWGVND